MVICKAQALLLKRLLEEKETGKEYTDLTDAETGIFHELEVAGLAKPVGVLKVTLTYWGEELARILRGCCTAGPLPPPEIWEESFRWIGSEIMCMLDSAQHAGAVGPVARVPLMARSLAVEVYEPRRKRKELQINDQGKHVLEIYRSLDRNLRISAPLADLIRRTPMGPAETSRLHTGPQEEHLLENMRLIAYSVPESRVYTFTGLGQAVKRTLELGGFATGQDVLTNDILTALAAVADDREESTEALQMLRELGYVGLDGELLEAGEWALEALRLQYSEPSRDVWTFAIQEEEVAVLKTIKDLQDKVRLNAWQTPTFDNLRAEMIERKEKHYKHALEEYGQSLREMPERYQEIVDRFGKARDVGQWYDDNFKLRESLLALEAFSLIQRGVDFKERETFSLTEYGQRVLADQGVSPKDVTSTAVKAITMTRREFLSPNVDWWTKSRAEGLCGTGEPSDSGLMYARLAEEIPRKPFLTLYEMKVLHRLAMTRMNIDELFQDLAGEDMERMRWALEKLEARHFVDILPDGNVVETPAGDKMDRALSGTPEGFGNPVTPVFLTVIKAISEVGNLYIKEKRIRALPRNLKEAIHRSGLSNHAFFSAVEAMRVAGLMGKTSITEAGLLLMEAAEAMNPPQGLRPFIEATRPVMAR